MTTRSRVKLKVAKDRDELRRLAAEAISRKIHSAVDARGVCSIALSGGSTPGPVYEELGNSDLAEKLPWSQLQIFFADERAVPMDHPDSNYRLVTETLLKSHREALGHTFRMPADAADREQAAKRYGRRLPDPLDVLVLGMGPDGHTASLFPGSAALDERDARVVPVVAPKPPPQRMTITPAVIERARAIIMIVTGAEKSPMVARALGGFEDPKVVPAQLARRALWIVDEAAAGTLKP
ncbi:MAG TPA: 6-phosphogluconolactonase [Planctomycetota bacterium]|jgi:6-phosphogluconolactonase|nr:6-phosphogluconolactonase [Planctomycetota bacterium]